MPYVDSRDGTRLFYSDWGTGRPIVLIHGWPFDSDMWEYQAVALAEAGFRVVSYDRRGFGRSDHPWSGYDYATFTDDLAAVLERLELRDVVLAGFSMGGGEVARYVARHGTTRVAKAVLIGSVTPMLLKTTDNPEGIDKSVFDGIVTSIAEDRPGFLGPFNKAFFGVGLLNRSVSSEFLRWSETRAMLASPKATRDCVRAWSETDFRADLRAFDLPTLIVHGDDDATVPWEKSGKLSAELVPSAEVKLYEGAPHGLFYTHRDRLTADLLLFAR
jgi:non-heme chloroperoxidase